MKAQQTVPATFVALLLAGCGGDMGAGTAGEAGAGAGAAVPAPRAEQPEEERRATRKPGAPVLIDAELVDGKGTVTIQFLTAATDVSVRLRGSDGLVVAGEPQVLKDGTFYRNDTFRAPCRYALPENRAALVVSVEGRFDGRFRGRVASFRPNPEAAPLQPDRPGAVTGARGLGAIEMPAGPPSTTR